MPMETMAEPARLLLQLLRCLQLPRGALPERSSRLRRLGVTAMSRPVSAAGSACSDRDGEEARAARGRLMLVRPLEAKGKLQPSAEVARSEGLRMRSEPAAPAAEAMWEGSMKWEVPKRGGVEDKGVDVGRAPEVEARAGA